MKNQKNSSRDHSRQQQLSPSQEYNEYDIDNEVNILNHNKQAINDMTD